VGKQNVYAPRTSFLNMSLKNSFTFGRGSSGTAKEGGSDVGSSSGSDESTSAANGSSFTKKMGASLGRMLQSKPLAPINENR
jgi:hypothetical protein